LENQYNKAFIDTLLQSYDKNVIASRTDLKGIITYASEAYQKISGYTLEELIGKPHSIARHKDMPKSVYKKMWETIKQQKTWEGEVKNITKDGQAYWVWAKIEPYYDEEGNHIGYSAIREDITAQQKLQELNNTLDNIVQEKTKELRDQLYIDPLTKLGSYQAFSKDIESYDTMFNILLLVNIDKFHNINSLYSFTTGNAILQEFAKILEEFNATREYKLYRTHADEFVLFQNNIFDDVSEYYEDIIELKKRLTEHKFYIQSIDNHINLDVTIGISLGQEDPFNAVDIALRYAKKHKLVFKAYDNTLNIKHKLQNTIEWKHKIKQAINENKIVPVYQPIVDINENILKYEVLTRIEDDDKTLIPPYKFLDEARSTKQYNDIMKIILDKTFKIMQNTTEMFSINISYEDIFNNLLINYIEEKLKKDPSISNRLVIEILETDAIEDSYIMDTFITKFKDYGVRIAIDDFGTGHSNLGHILKLDPDYLKIDGTFIKNIHEDKSSFALVKSVVAFCKELEITTIAEFVHSKEIFDILKEIGIDEYQGFYFSPPKTDIK